MAAFQLNITGWAARFLLRRVGHEYTRHGRMSKARTSIVIPTDPLKHVCQQEYAVRCHSLTSRIHFFEQPL